MNPNSDLPGKEAYRSSQVNLSPYVTVVAFDPLIPLARIPVPAGQEEDPSKGPYVLAFRNDETWRQSWRTCKENVVTQCEAGAKVGCSISAAKACRQPWWKAYLPFLGSGSDDPSKREECERREMRSCLLSSHELCFTYARETCVPVYSNMRIAIPGTPIDRRFNGRPLRRPRVTRHDKLPTQASSPSNPETAGLKEEELRLARTTFLGRELMQYERRDDSWERMAHWSFHGAPHEDMIGTIPKEGWVGGLVHPALRSPSPHIEKEYPTSKGPICIASEWLQKLQRFVMDKLSS